MAPSHHPVTLATAQRTWETNDPQVSPWETIRLRSTSRTVPAPGGYDDAVQAAHRLIAREELLDPVAVVDAGTGLYLMETRALDEAGYPPENAPTVRPSNAGQPQLRERSVNWSRDDSSLLALVDHRGDVLDLRNA